MAEQTLGAMIATLRKENSMTQQELADKLGVTDKAVSKWERNISCPDIATLPHLAEIFGVSVDELMQVKSSEKTDSKANDIKEVISIILKAVPLAMGVGVVVLSVLKELNIYSGFAMLGIGLLCLSLDSLSNGKKS